MLSHTERLPGRPWHILRVKAFFCEIQDSWFVIPNDNQLEVISKLSVTKISCKGLLKMWYWHRWTFILALAPLPFNWNGVFIKIWSQIWWNCCSRKSLHKVPKVKHSMAWWHDNFVLVEDFQRNKIFDNMYLNSTLSKPL